MSEAIDRLLRIIEANNGIHEKSLLAKVVVEECGLIRDRSVYYCTDYAIRFSMVKTQNFGNTVISLSHLQKFDDRPFIVCVVTATQNYCVLANSTFLKKISHSSHELRTNNIRGSFNGSDISRNFEGIENTPDNFARLFAIHEGIGFDGNLERLVDATNNISPSGSKYNVSSVALTNILESPQRAIGFTESADLTRLKHELDERVVKCRNEILLAALIENVNIRGRVIEYLIAGADENLRQNLIVALQSTSGRLPAFKTQNTLGDFQRQFDLFDTETDVKTKILIRNSNPKAYNLDKMLEFLARDRSVFMFYFVGIDPGKIVSTVLLSMFQRNLLQGTILLKHWAGRNSRGVSQFDGKVIDDLIGNPDSEIDEQSALDFLNRILAL